MPASRRKAIPVDSLLQLRQRLDHLPKKSPERARQVALVAELYGVSSSTVYRALALLHRPRASLPRFARCSAIRWTRRGRPSFGKRCKVPDYRYERQSQRV